MLLNLCLITKFYCKESMIYRLGHGLRRRRCTSSSPSTSSQCGWEPIRDFTTEVLPSSPTLAGTILMIVSLVTVSPTIAGKVSVLFFFFFFFPRFLIPINLSYWFQDGKNNAQNINYGCILMPQTTWRFHNCKNAGSSSKSPNHWGSETGIRNPCFLIYL